MTVVEWVKPPAVAVIVTVYVPVAVLRLVLTVSAEELVVGFGLKLAEERFGKPLTLKVAALPKPLRGVIATV
jgi:hypothetical protein